MIGSDTHTAYHPLWLSRHYCPIEKSLSSLLLTITLAAHNNISAAKFLEHAACPHIQGPLWPVCRWFTQLLFGSTQMIGPWSVSDTFVLTGKIEKLLLWLECAQQIMWVIISMQDFSSRLMCFKLTIAHNQYTSPLIERRGVCNQLGTTQSVFLQVFYLSFYFDWNNYSQN
jgi:hypothetical protein